MALSKVLKAGLALGAALFTATGVLANEPSIYNLRPGVTEVSESVFELHMMVVWIMTAIAVVVFGAMFIAMYKFRKSKNPTPATFSHSTLLEIIWTAIPVIILVILSIPAVKLLIKMEDTEKADMTVMVTASQWKWHYKYLGETYTYNDQTSEIEFFSNLKTKRDVFENYNGAESEKHTEYLLDVDNEVVLPINKKVRLLITADDVIHSWWIPDFAVKKDAIPGFVNEAWTKIDKPGVYRGQCTELCGKDHGFMPIVVRAVTEAEYAKWLEDQKVAGVEAAKLAEAEAAKSWSMEDLMAKGEEVYLAKCAACHQASGEGAGPFPALKGSAMATKTEQVGNHISIVVDGKAGTAMQAFGPQLTDAELAAVITFERNAWGNNTGEMVQPADISAHKAGQ